MQCHAQACQILPENSGAHVSDATPVPPSEPLVLSRREGSLTRITLNRPRALNALTTDMAVTVRDALSVAQTDGSTAVLLDGAGDRGFCGGGDVKAMVAGGTAGAHAFLWDEYRTDAAIHASKVPVVGIMHGITMGGGIGLTGHAAVRVVTELSRLAMPETRIGIVPDVGSNVMLAHATGRLGDMLAAASTNFTAGDAIALGFADFYVHSSRLDELAQRLSTGEDPRTATAALAEEPPASELLATAGWFEQLAIDAMGSAAKTLADPKAAVLRLVAALEDRARGLNAHGSVDRASAGAGAADDSVCESVEESGAGLLCGCVGSVPDRARALAAEIRSVCPTAVVVALAQVAKGRAGNLSVAETLTDDYLVLSRMVQRADFHEGTRAQLIDKDGAPRWSPATLEEVDMREIARIIDPKLAAGEHALEI